MKSEPDAYSIDDLCRDGSEPWDGIRNYQARNMMRDDMQMGDRVFFYHSNCDDIGIVGIAQVTSEAYPDPTAWDPNDHHYDPKSSPEEPRWCMVDIQFDKKFDEAVSLETLRDEKPLADMELLRKGSRLSVQPVTKSEFDHILKMTK